MYTSVTTDFLNLKCVYITGSNEIVKENFVFTLLDSNCSRTFFMQRNIAQKLYGSKKYDVHCGKKVMRLVLRGKTALLGRKMAI